MIKFETHIISLDRTPERFKKTYEKLRKEKLDPRKFSATDGYKVYVEDLKNGKEIIGKDLKLIQKYSSDYKIICDPGNEKYSFIYSGMLLNAGEYGLWCSDYRLLKYAKTKNLSGIIIFEDDISPANKDFAKSLKDFISHLPNDFDIGWIGHPGYAMVREYDEYVSRPISSWHGTYGIVISNNGINKLLNYNYYYEPIDLFFVNECLSDNLNCYLSTNSLVDVDQSGSVINEMK